MPTDRANFFCRFPTICTCIPKVSYFSKKAYEEMQKKAEEGLLLLAKWLQWMWD